MNCANVPKYSCLHCILRDVQVVAHCESEYKVSMTSKLKAGQSTTGRTTADGTRKIHESWTGAVCSTLMDNHVDLLKTVCMQPDVMHELLQ